MAEKRESNIVIEDLRTGKTYDVYHPADGGFVVSDNKETVKEMGNKAFFSAVTSKQFIPADCYRFVVKKDMSSLSVKIDVDVSDELKGLKAVTREAKKATAALKELEEQQCKSRNITLNLDNKRLTQILLSLI
ncbi:hypothetical protein [Bacillus sp. UNC438CL73TsuS30]|uniref:hypothetical protein n=1 Tax=Bacillus sp. UNC438CL73TsuS30 TaxID=1340434 RepID=UPI000558EEA5|nr:hypothetical protein [Bacillus sp. UNC438CL73TsuS30]